MNKKISSTLESTSDGKLYEISYEVDWDEDTENIVISVTNNDGATKMITAFDANEFKEVFNIINSDKN